ncbi:hypothetical protein A2363_00810 [Candidatus Gottesmanbacteria bacterium RIFOXYB1_FULL_47_11]|uniref:Uncharacterized protein n=1 Tax=Candidatus Gottesmanbacteria bacterium RIFOXYB1_FULL_47_11 TaxID=1798401 RepID=A0A1F6BGH2_9BACT|nr:MAG: hypothetical protein A2363_00810 [Candidatus Gottesmanbacteria bacterium RIFOXYB1_FULL_47_11]
MANIFETIKSQQIAAQNQELELKRAETQRQIDQWNIAKNARDIQNQKDTERFKAIKMISPIVEKVLSDMASVLGEGFSIEGGSYENTWTLGRMEKSSIGSGGDRFTSSDFVGQYTVELAFSTDRPHHFRCSTSHSISIKKLHWENGSLKHWQSKALDPIDCGLTETELANSLYRLYSKIQLDRQRR